MTIFNCRIKNVRSVIVCRFWTFYLLKIESKMSANSQLTSMLCLPPLPPPVRLVDGEASVWHGPGGAPGEEPPGDRPAPGGLCHDAAWDWHEGGGRDWEVTLYCPSMISNVVVAKQATLLLSCFLFDFLSFIQIICYHCDYRERYNSWSNLNYFLFDCDTNGCWFADLCKNMIMPMRSHYSTSPLQKTSEA